MFLKEVIDKNKVLFVLIWLVMVGYILRDLVVVNFEPLLFIIFVFSIYIIRSEILAGKIIDNAALKMWIFLIFFYWVVAFAVLFYHDGLDGRSGNVMNIVHSTLAFAVLGWSIYRLNPSIDYLWFSVGLGSFLLLFLSLFELVAVDFDLGVRLGDFYGNPIGFGVLSGTFLIILFGALPWAYAKNKIVFLAYFTMIVFLFFNVLYSQTRTAWLGLPEAIIAWSVYYYFLLKRKYQEKNNSYKVNLAFISLVSMGLISIVTSTTIANRVGDALSGVEDYFSRVSFETSAGQRLLMYEAGLAGIKANFGLGIGENKFKELMKEKTQEVAQEHFSKDFQGVDYSHVHNQFLMAFITKGILGILSVLLLFVFLFAYFVRGMRKADFEDKPIWISGFVFVLAEFMSFIPESPLQKSVYTTHFFLISTLFIVFTAISADKNQSKVVQ